MTEVTKHRAKKSSLSTAETAADKSKVNPNALHVRKRDGESQAETVARYTLLPEVQAGMTIKQFERGPMVGASLDHLVERLAEQSVLSNKGDLSRSESLLTAQAHTLVAIFHDLARRAAVSEYLSGCDTYLRLAFKAQSQCRATIETLAEIKNPSHVTFAKQANIANGLQQINNGVSSRAENSQNPPNKLLEHTRGEWLEPISASGAVGGDSAMAAVGTLSRATND